MGKRVARTAVAAAVLVTGLTLGAPQAASAHAATGAGITPNSCQNTYAVFTGRPVKYKFNCTGTHPVYDDIYAISVGGWSGWFTYYDGGPTKTEYFCDFQNYASDIIVYNVYLSPTKEPWC